MSWIISKRNLNINVDAFNYSVRRTSDDVICKCVVVLRWDYAGDSDVGMLLAKWFSFFASAYTVYIYTIRTCVRSPSHEGPHPNGRDLCHSQGRAAELLLKSSRVVFGIIIHPISETLFFFLLTTVPLARAQRLASFFPTHVSPHDSAAADNQRRSFWNVIGPPPYRRWSVIDYHRRSLNLGENVVCITFGILIFWMKEKEVIATLLLGEER